MLIKFVDKLIFVANKCLFNCESQLFFLLSKNTFSYIAFKSMDLLFSKWLPDDLHLYRYFASRPKKPIFSLYFKGFFFLDEIT